MLATSLVTERDVLLAGSAMQAYGSPDPRVETFARLQNGMLPPAHSARTLRRLQPNVRVALAELELTSGLEWPAPGDGVRASIGKRHAGGHQEALLFVRPQLDIFRDQTKKVLSYSDLRLERAAEVLAQVVPQSAAWSAIAGLTPERHRYTLELMGAGLRLAMLAVMHLKHALGVPRPMEFSPAVQPMILTPGYTAFPSGHATEAYFIARFLPKLVHTAAHIDAAHQRVSRQSVASQLHRLAFRVAENRVVAGLHFPIDSLGGQLLGHWLADYAGERCGLGEQRPVSLSAWKFEVPPGVGGEYIVPALDEDLLDTGPNRGWLPKCVELHPSNSVLQAVKPPHNSVLLELTTLAKQEWE
jgi:hypothetical protein